MHTNSYSLEVLVNGRPAQEYYKDGKSFIEARQGSEYTLRFRNNSWKRVLAIFSVDGVEVLKGKAAAQAENGYIVDAFSSIEVKGYRIDEENVASFRFTEGQQSYAVTVGAAKKTASGQTVYDKTDRNNGVIGVRVFEEDVAAKDYAATYKRLPKAEWTGGGVVWGASTPSKLYHVSGCAGSIFTHSVGTSMAMGGMAGLVNGGEATMPRSLLRSSSLSCANLVSEGPIEGLAPNFDVGSTWGTKVTDKVREVSFKRAATSVDIEIYYASRASLEQFGIDFSRTKQVFNWPSAFEDKKQYCKVPEGYKL